MKPLPSCPSCKKTIPFSQSFSRIGRIFICRNCGERLVVPRPFLIAILVLVAVAAIILLLLDDRKTLGMVLLATMALLPILAFLITPVRRQQ